jgi:hypothetical protein
MAYTETIRRICADAGYCYEVRPNADVPGITDIRYVESDGKSDRTHVTVNVEELRQLITALQARLPEAEAEEKNL